MKIKTKSFIIIGIFLIIGILTALFLSEQDNEKLSPIYIVLIIILAAFQPKIKGKIQHFFKK